VSRLKASQGADRSRRSLSEAKAAMRSSEAQLEQVLAHAKQATQQAQEAERARENATAAQTAAEVTLLPLIPPLYSCTMCGMDIYRYILCLLSSILQWAS
jgi:hypothetical protein